MLLGLMRLGRLLGGLLLVTVLLAGCTDDEPDPDPSPSPSPSDSASSPTASPSAEPESAEEFIERWARSNNEMKATGDPAGFLELTRRCDPCEDLASLVAGFYEEGGFVRTRGWTVQHIEPVTSSSGRPVYVLAVRSAPTRYREAEGEQVKTLPGGDFTYRVTLKKTADGWKVTDYVEVST